VILSYDIVIFWLLFFYSIIVLSIHIIILYLIIQKYNKSYALPNLYPIDVSIDCCFTKQEKEAIIESLLIWQKATCGLITFHIINLNNDKLIFNDKNRSTSSYTINFVCMLHEDKETKKYDDIWQSQILGLAQGFEPCCLIFVVVDRIKDCDTFVATCLHEIGHLLGLDHNINENTLMYRYIRYTKPTWLDLENLVDVWRNEINNY